MSSLPLFAEPAAPFALRPYQQKALRMVDEAVAAGSRRPLLVLPTGAGKTVVAADLIRREVDRGGSALFLAPRRELVHQASRKLADARVRHGLFLAGHEARRDVFAAVHVASIDTLLAMTRRRGLPAALPEFSLVLVDEAHLAVTIARQRLLDRWPAAVRLGLTATPTRKDGRALGVMFDELIEPTTVADLTRDGYLVPARYFSVAEPDLQRVRVVAGEFNAHDLDAAVNRPELVGDIVQHWLAHATGRRTVVFASSIAHSIALSEAFLRAGVRAEHVDAGTPEHERAAIFERFSSGATEVLTNCFLASYGFDLPELSCVVLARPTRSLTLYLQMLGRGLRTALGKRDCLVLDHSGCVHRHGFADDPRAWTLDGERALVEPTASDPKPRDPKRSNRIDCPECRAVFGGTNECPECGFVLRPRGREIETLDGELVEVGHALPPEAQDRFAFFLELRGYCAERGWKPGAAAHRYRDRFGEFPPRAWNQHPAATPSLATRRWIKSRQIAFAKARSKAR